VQLSMTEQGDAPGDSIPGAETHTRSVLKRQLAVWERSTTFVINCS